MAKKTIEQIQKNLDAFIKAGAGKEDQIAYLKSEGLSPEETKSLSPENAFLSTPGIERELERRKLPTRFEQFISKNPAMKAYLEYQNQNKIPYLPTGARVTGEMIDLPWDIIQGLGRSLSTGSYRQPTKLADILGAIATSIGTSFRHAPTSFEQSPLTTALDWYLAGQTAKGAVGLAKTGYSAAKGAYRAIRPAETPLVIGKQAENQLQMLKKSYGAAVGEEKNIINQMSGIINTRPVIQETLTGIKNKGLGPLRKDIGEIRRNLYETGLPKRFKLDTMKDVDRALQWISNVESVGVVPRKALELRDTIGELQLPAPKPGQIRIAKGTDYGDVLRVKMKEGIEKGLTDLDIRPEFGGTGGKWIAFNDKYADLMKTYKQVMPKLDTLTAEDYMDKIGDKILQGHTGYTSLWQNVDRLTGMNTTERLRDYMQLSKGVEGLKYGEILGTKPGKLIEALGDIGAVGLRKGARFIERLPTSKLGLAAAILPPAARELGGLTINQ